MIGRGAEPDVHHGVGVGIDVVDAEQAGLIVLRVHEALDERGEVERDDGDLHADGGEILLDERSHLLAGALPALVRMENFTGWPEGS